MPASILAAATGLRSGSTRTLIPMPIRLVRPATKASRVTGSSRGWSGSNGAGSASPYGYGDVMVRGMTVWSPTHSPW